MAINWFLALKAVPWTDLVQAAPSIVKGARKLFAGTRAGGAESNAQTPGSEPGASSSVEARLGAVEATLATIVTEQQATVELVRSLAEQNARVVEAMAIIRARARILLALGVVLLIAFVTLVAWVITR